MIRGAARASPAACGMRGEVAVGAAGQFGHGGQGKEIARDRRRL